jgi:PEP-CTERM motif-containing protein
MTRKTCLGFLIVPLILALSIGTAYAGTVSGDKARALWKFSYEDTLSTGTVNDFHIRLVDPSQNINVLTATVNSIGAPPGQSTVAQGAFQNGSNNSKQVDIDFGLQSNYDKGQGFSLWLSIQQKKRNQITVQNAYFTKDKIYAGGPGPNIGINGFKWEDPSLVDNLFLTYDFGLGSILSPLIDNGADGTVNGNDDEAWGTIFVHNLQLFLNQPDYDFSDGNDSILGTLTPDLVVGGPIAISPGGQMGPIAVTGWNPGTFIWATGIVANNSDLALATYTQEFTFGHQTVPEPPTILSMSLGLVALLVARKRKAGEGYSITALKIQ